MTKVDIVKLQNIADRVWNYRTAIVYNSMFGKYKNYKSNVKEYASYALENFDVVKNIKFPQSPAIPLFSLEGLNMMKTMFLDFFRFHTKDEKLLKKMYREYQIKQLVNEAIPIPKKQFNPARIKNAELSRKVAFSFLMGNHKDYVSNTREYASFIVKNPDMANYSLFGNVRVPVFSKEVFNILKISILDKFRTKTKNEKLMREIIKTEKAENPMYRVYH